MVINYISLLFLSSLPEKERNPTVVTFFVASYDFTCVLPKTKLNLWYYIYGAFHFHTNASMRDKIDQFLLRRFTTNEFRSSYHWPLNNTIIKLDDTFIHELVYSEFSSISTINHCCYHILINKKVHHMLTLLHYTNRNMCVCIVFNHLSIIFHYP